MAASHRLGRSCLVFTVLMGLWLVLSGMYDVFHVTWGVFGAGVLTWLSAKRHPKALFPYLRFFLFIPWQLWQILLSNLRVARLVLRPRIPLQSQLMVYEHGLTDPRTMTLLGCAMTLTPGTLTVDIDADQMIIHALDEASVEDVKKQVIANRVRGVFGKIQS